MTRDVFLCHASEDKLAVVRPLYEALRVAGISCWLDEAEIRWGDSIVDKINGGLRDSRFVLVVLSAAFLAKPWPRRELASALSIESSSGVVRVLPLLVGSLGDRQAILNDLPLLADKLHLVWDGDGKEVVEAMRRRVRRLESESCRPGTAAGTTTAPMPYCKRCGARVGTPSGCIGTYTYHDFTMGTGQEFCKRCGARAGTPSGCIGTYTYHDFTMGTGQEFCKRCGARVGTPSGCIGTYTYHDF